VVTISRDTLFPLFKYTIYAFLAFNVYVFFGEEFAAAKLQFPAGIPPGAWIEAYAATIDTAAWLVLLLMFELETYVLSDEHFTRRVTVSLHSLRILSYAFIVYAFYGYIANLVFVGNVVDLPAVSDLCALADSDWVYAVDLDEYAPITAANCTDFSSADSFVRFGSMQAAVDAAGLVAITSLAWIDVVNAAVWLLVVLILEIDVRLQEHDRFEGLALKLSNFFKVLLYSALFYAAVYWGIKGDFVDFWDAFLWLIAFVFIELNVFEWRQEAIEEAEQLAEA
jgi:uncharacterized protein with PQ loop repeat